MKRNIYLIVFLLLEFSCNTKVEINSEVILLDLFSKNKLEFDSIRLVKLESSQDLLLGSEIKFKIDLNNIYCLDNSNLHTVLRFDWHGNFLNSFGKRGKGPTEYPNITDFFVDKDTVVTQSSVGLKSQLYFYNIQGKFLFRKDSEISSQTIERIDQNYYMYVSYNKALYDYRLFITNNNFNKTKSFLKNKSMLDIPIFEENFNKSNTALTFIEAFNNNAYIIDENILKEKFNFDFGKYSIPKEFYRKKTMEGIEMIDKIGFANIRRYFESPSYSSFVITIQKENNPANIINLVYDKINKKILQIKFNEENKPILSNLIAVTEKDEFIFLIYPHFLLKQKAKLEQLNIENRSVINNLMEMDNPVLAICKIKEL